MTSTITAIFGILVLLGGCIGYARARSMMSLLSGLACGALLVYASRLMPGAWAAGAALAAAVSALLAVTFAIRWKKTGAFMPAGMLLLLSLAELVVLALRP